MSASRFVWDAADIAALLSADEAPDEQDDDTLDGQAPAVEAQGS